MSNRCFLRLSIQLCVSIQNFLGLILILGALLDLAYLLKYFYRLLFGKIPVHTAAELNPLRFMVVIIVLQNLRPSASLVSSRYSSQGQLPHSLVHRDVHRKIPE